MTPERWQQVKHLFDLAIEREPNQRAAFLDEACVGDPDLRREVEPLLAYDEKECSLIEAPAVEVAAELLANRAEPVTGRRIGPYQVLREIGRGGMGAVYLAVRSDEQFQKQVAIKLVKRGMDTDAILCRFRNEQQILANLDHPNIAKLLDGGTTDDGLSYFIMDYVEGLPVDAYCDKHKLDTVKRLKLFQTACSAVQYAHQNHVIHRDVKPGNILVTSAGVPKLLDFGIAKLLNSERSLLTMDSIVALRPMTPEYASPEQIRGETVTQASDIYSLGVLLYKLLTGHRPYRVWGGAPAEIERVICEEEPEKPSAAIRRVEKAPETYGTPPTSLTPESVSRTRDGQPEKLRRRLAGDLDNILLMALRKDPFGRYASVEQFSEDIRRHLERRPVIARKDTLAYRSVKFLRRNRAVLLASLLTAFFLLAVIGLGRFLPVSRDQGADGPIESVAVLPLANLSGDAAQDYFADGMTEDLIAGLAKIRALRVISRTSVMSYKQAPKPVPEIGRQLRVEAVVEGSVARAGDRVRITMQLIHAATDRHLWTETYERDLRDAPALANEVARAIAQAIKIKLTPQERVRLASAHPVKREAYEAYLKGRYFWNKGTAESLKKGIEYFEQSIATDPGYALAYAGLADSYNLMGLRYAAPEKRSYPKAKAAAMKALELEDTLAEAHASLGYAKLHFDFDWTGAGESFRRALELNPNSAIAHNWYGIYLTTLGGRHAEAIAEGKRALELDPLSLLSNRDLGSRFYYARQYDAAIDHCQKALELDPSFSFAHGTLGRALEQKGMYGEAIETLRKGITVSGGRPMLIALLGHVYATSGRRDEAVKILGNLQELSKRQFVSSDSIALVYAALGEKDQAFAWLEKAYTEPAFVLLYLKVDPMLDSLRADPRFADLVRRVGLPP